MQAATVYQSRGMIYLHSSSKTTTGIWIATPPFIKVLPGDRSVLGDAALTDLAASLSSVSHPENWTGVLAPLLEVANVKTWSTFIKTAASVHLEMERQRLRIIPQMNLGPNAGFESLTESATELSATAPAAEIGFGLELALSVTSSHS